MERSAASLPDVAELLVVCAHPDDESFGLGGVLGAFVDRGTQVRVLCFTHGEASTLGEDAALGERRAAELDAAARALGVQEATLHAYPDGRLAAVALDELVARIAEQAGDADLLLAFDAGGITGHPDHIRATEAALAFGTDRRLPVLGWVLPEEVAAQLNAELGTSFAGRRPDELDLTVAVDRDRQQAAIACHASQSTDNPVLWRRLELLGSTENLRWLLPPPRARVA
ncbi:MAG: PIG-L family deacetylase [Actinomycetota bacterium]|nr:PIG-L family deacetylase [Actinomycetota bacterium]